MSLSEPTSTRETPLVVDVPLARSAVRGLLVRSVGLALGFVSAAVLARTLGAEGLGAYQGTLALGVIGGGLAAAITERPTTRRLATLDPVVGKPTVAAEIQVAHVAAGLAVIAVVLGLLVASVVPGVPDAWRAALRVAALITPGAALLSLRQWIALPLRGVAASIAPEQIAAPILFLVLLGAVSTRFLVRAEVVAVLYALATMVVWIVAAWRLGVLAAIRRARRPTRWLPVLVDRVREGRPFVGLTTWGLLPVYATIPIVAALGDVADAGRFAVAQQVAGLVGVPLQIVSLAAMPRCARLHAEGDDVGLAKVVRLACGLSLGLGGLCALVLAIGIEPILAVFGPGFAAAAQLVAVLVAGQLVNAALGPNGPTLQMIGREHDARRIEAATTVVRLVAVAVAASAGSAVAVAGVVAATTVARNVALTVTLHHRSGILALPLPLPWVRT